MPCSHLREVTPEQYRRKPNTPGKCEECVKTGDRWLHLRMCLTCGKVGCCDSSRNKHATAHFHSTKHPVMRSVEPGETWMWCYVDEEGEEPRQ